MLSITNLTNDETTKKMKQPKRSEQIDPEIMSLLLEKEQIIVSASQKRLVPGGSIHTPNAIYVTNLRVLFKDPKWLGMKANIVDVDYKDISNIRLKRGIFSTEIYLEARHHSDEVRLPAVDKDIASQIHSMIQKGIRGELLRRSDIFDIPQDSESVNTDLSRSVNNNEDSSQGAVSSPKVDDPLKILKIRFAKGEITKEQYQEMRRMLES
jgi:Bacterial PH domain/Short C-terminal domain